MLRMNKDLLKSITDGDTDRFYNSRTWRRKRKEIINRDNRECQKCKGKGVVTVGIIGKPLSVHHIKHLRDYPLLALSSDNLTTLCDVCHNEEHPEKNSECFVEKFTNEEHWE